MTKPTESRGEGGLSAEPDSFIVKIWVEATDHKSEPRWHGQITHVPDGERRYLRRLEEISGFIRPYLEHFGIQFSVKSWFYRWRKR